MEDLVIILSIFCATIHQSYDYFVSYMLTTMKSIVQTCNIHQAYDYLVNYMLTTSP